MSATTTVWPLLAGITVAGTLGATFLTGSHAARREDAQWKRQRHDRHEEDRKQQYANLWNAPTFLEAVTSGKVGTHAITEAAPS